MADYDTYYQTPNLFGHAYPELIDFFNQYKPKGRLLDLGCGQGRNAVPLARLGYKVSGIDISHVGIDQIKAVSYQEELHIDVWVDDIYTFDHYSDYDIVLLDSMFHFNKKDEQRETRLIDTIARSIPKHALICFCIQDNGKKVKMLKNTTNSTNIDFKTLNDSSLLYKFEDKKTGHTSETKYRLYIIKKIN